MLFQGIRGRAQLLQAATPEQVVEVIENELGIRPGDWRR
jgi:hypothetical protein